MTVEIEKKFLLKKMPLESQVHKEVLIYQNYLSKKGDEQLRIRQVVEGDNRSFFCTYKKGSGLIREEIEFEIGERLYFDLSEKAGTKALKKIRKHVSIGEQVAEIDIYQEDLSPLIVVEVEFSTEKEAAEFNPPEWCGEDISDDKRYKNGRLWKSLQR